MSAAAGTAPAGVGPRVAAQVRVSTRNNFDLIRLFAATQVALKHALVHLNVDDHYIEMLSVFPGVPIFFLISGYLIYQSWQNAGGAAAFFTNRVLRIYPALVLCFVVSVAIVVGTGYLDPGTLATRPFWLWAGAQLSFVQIYNPDFLRGFGVGAINGSLWTITVELQFYLLTPLLAWAVAGRPATWWWLLGGFALAHLAGTLWHDGGFALKLYLVSFPPWFVMFVLGAFVSTRPGWLARIRAANVWLVLAAYAAAQSLAFALGLNIVGNEINLLSYLFLAALVFKLAYLNPDLSYRLLGKNDISYGVYIYHMPLVNLFLHLGWAGHGAQVVACMALTFLLAGLSWWAVERPALAMKRLALRKY